jgi:type IV secretory pathway TrbD component
MPRPAAKSLNKPLVIAGVDRKLVGLCFLIAVIVGASSDAITAKVIAGVLFVFLCGLGRRLTRHDPNIFEVMNHYRKQKGLYDPAKREWFRSFIDRQPE